MLTEVGVVVAPATGTPETGGWSTRELRTILRGLDGLNLIAADIVEVAVSPDGSRVFLLLIILMILSRMTGLTD